jgi:hypothetical protein
LKAPPVHDATRAAAASAVAKIAWLGKTQRVLSRLEELSVENVEQVRLAALRSLIKLLTDGAGSVELLLGRIVSMLDDPKAEVRIVALDAVHDLGEAAVTAMISTKVSKPLRDKTVLAAATRAVAKLGAAITQDDLDVLLGLLGGGDWWSQRAAARCLETLMLSGWRFFGTGVDKLRLMNITTSVVNSHG